MPQKKPQAAAQGTTTQNIISKGIANKVLQLRTALREKVASSPALYKLKPQQRLKLNLALANFCNVSSRILSEQAGHKNKRSAAPASTESAATAQFTVLLETVDFPGFVSSLIEGTFNAIVGASIEQMQAYADLLNAVATALSGFDDHRPIRKKTARQK